MTSISANQVSTPPMFFACYLLTPVQPPQRLRCTYVGFTVAPTRRIRQHNGELAAGAKRTRKNRPWEMVAVVHGFPSKFRALQFEWVWQHPMVSKITRTHLQFLRGSRGLGAPRSVKRKMLEMLEMVNLEPWKALGLTVSFTTDEMHNIARSMGERYSAGKCETRALDTFEGVHKDVPSTSTCNCFICEYPLETLEDELEDMVGCYHDGCGMCCHLTCLMDHFRSMGDSVEGAGDKSGKCPQCEQELQWSLLTQHHGEEKETKRRRRGGRRKQGKKRVRLSGEKGDVADGRPTTGGNTRERGEVDAADVVSIASSTSTRSFTVEYNSDGWFEENDFDARVASEGADRSWGTETPLNTLDTQVAQPCNCDAETIDLTEE